MKTTAEMIAVMQAAKEDGSNVETRNLLNRPDHWCPCRKDYIWNWCLFDYRIKPELRYRPWKPEEVPVGALIRWKANPNSVYVILAINADAGTICVTFKDGLHYADLVCLFKFNEYSTDRVTWLPCGVLEEA